MSDTEQQVMSNTEQTVMSDTKKRINYALTEIKRIDYRLITTKHEIPSLINRFLLLFFNIDINNEHFDKMLFIFLL